MKKVKYIVLAVFFAMGILVSLSFTRTMHNIMREYMIDREHDSNDNFNEIYFKKGFWVNPNENNMQGAGLQKIFSYPIYFKPSMKQAEVHSVNFDLAISPVKGNIRIKNISDEFLIVLFNSSAQGALGFRISPVNYIQSGWVEMRGGVIRLIRAVEYKLESDKSERVKFSIAPGAAALTIGNNSYSLPGNYGKGGVGFFLGTAATSIKNLEIKYDEKTYRDLTPYMPAVPPAILILIFLLPLISWIGYSYAMSRYFGFDAFKFLLSDFPVIFLFLFFKVNPHKTLFYAVPLVLVLIFCIRSMIFSKFLYHLKDTRDIRKKGFAILSGVTIAVFMGVYLLALFYSDKLQIGETYLEKKEMTLPLLVAFLLVSDYLLMYSEKLCQLTRIAAISAAAVVFSVIPKYYNPNSYFATSDKLFKPNAMYYHYNGLAKTKQMEKMIPETRRVFFAGGSATYGFPMGIDGKAFPEQFEGLMNKKNARLDIFNLGMMGHTMSSLRYSIEKNDILNKYPMDMLILYVGYNDATIFPKLYGFQDKTDWQSINYMNRSSLPHRVFRMIRFSPPMSYLLLAKSMFTEPAVPSKNVISKGGPLSGTNVPRVTTEEESEQVDWFQKECGKRNIKLIIVPELLNRVRSLSEAISQNPQQRAIVDSARKLRIPVIDCYPEFDSSNNYYMYDLVHLTDHGNKKLAELLSVKLAPYLN